MTNSTCGDTKTNGDGMGTFLSGQAIIEVPVYDEGRFQSFLPTAMPGREFEAYCAATPMLLSPSFRSIVAWVTDNCVRLSAGPYAAFAQDMARTPCPCRAYSSMAAFVVAATIIAIRRLRARAVPPSVMRYAHLTLRAFQLVMHGDADATVEWCEGLMHDHTFETRLSLFAWLVVCAEYRVQTGFSELESESMGVAEDYEL